MNIPAAEKPLQITFYGICIGFLLVVLSLIFYGTGGTSDLATHHKWLTLLLDNPLAEAYASGEMDYPPLFVFSFYPVAFWDPVVGLWVVIYLTLAINLLVSTALVYLLTRNASAALLFYVASFYPIIILKYTDINFMPALLLSLWALKHQRYFLFSLLYTVACFIKWQPMMLGPFLVLMVLRPGPGLIRRFLASAAGFITVFMVTIWIFGFETTYRAFTVVTGEPIISANAINLHWITTWALHLLQPEVYGGLTNGEITYLQPPSGLMSISKIPFAICYSLSLYAFYRSGKQWLDLLKYSLLGYLAYFALNTGVHENHLYLGAMMAILLSGFEKQRAPIAWFLVISMYLNLLLFEGLGQFSNTHTFRMIFVDITLPLAIVFTLFSLVYWYNEVAPVLKRNQ